MAAAAGGMSDALAYLKERDPFMRLVMRAVADAADEWHQLYVHNGTVTAHGGGD